MFCPFCTVNTFWEVRCERQEASSVLTRNLSAGNAVRACGHPRRELEEGDGRTGRRQIGFVVVDAHGPTFTLAAVRVVVK